MTILVATVAVIFAEVYLRRRDRRMRAQNGPIDIWEKAFGYRRPR